MAVVLAVTAVALLTVGAVAWRRAESWACGPGLDRARQELAAQLGTDEVELAVAARPLVPALLRRPGTQAQMTARGVPLGRSDGLLRRLDAEVPAVHLDVRAWRLTTSAGTFTARLGADDLARSVRLPGVVARLELRHHGLRVWTVLGVPVDTRTELRDGQLLVHPDPLQVRDLLRLPGLGAFRRTLEAGGLRIALPELPLGAQVTAIRFGNDRAEVSGTFEPLTVPLGRPRSGHRR